MTPPDSTAREIARIEPPMTAKRIQTILHGHLFQSSDLLIPRYTPPGWWECDLWRLTKTGMVDEYEIKLSVSDFRADSHKEMRDWSSYSFGVPAARKNKHELLASSRREGPNRFWFVMPEAVADKIECPSFAGLIAVTEWGVQVRTRAPKRHKEKWAGDRLGLLMKFYHRYWHHEAVKVADAEPIKEPVQ